MLAVGLARHCTPTTHLVSGRLACFVQLIGLEGSQWLTARNAKTFTLMFSLSGSSFPSARRSSWALGRSEHFSLETREAFQPGRETEDVIISRGRMAGKTEISKQKVFLAWKEGVVSGEIRVKQEVSGSVCICLRWYPCENARIGDDGDRGNWGWPWPVLTC